MRFVLEPNDVQPISFDLVLSGVTPPFFEDRNLARNPRTGRVDVNVDPLPPGRLGRRGRSPSTVRPTRSRPGEWFGFRDHSWGVRQGVGRSRRPDRASRGLTPRARPAHRSQLKWTPLVLPTARRLVLRDRHPRSAWLLRPAFVNEADGTQTTRAVASSPACSYDPRTRFVLGGELHAHDGVGGGTGDRGRGARRIRLLPQDRRLRRRGAATCTARGRARSHLDGEHIADCWDDEHLARPRAAPRHAHPGAGGRRRRATGSWRASSAGCGPSSASPPTPTTDRATCEHHERARRRHPQRLTAWFAEQLPGRRPGRAGGLRPRRDRPFVRDLPHHPRRADGGLRASTRRRRCANGRRSRGCSSRTTCSASSTS